MARRPPGQSDRTDAHDPHQQEKLRAGVQRLQELEIVSWSCGGLDQLRQKLQKLLAEARIALADERSWPVDEVAHDGVDERLQFVDKALAADGFMEALEVLRRSEAARDLGVHDRGARVERHQRLAMERWARRSPCSSGSCRTKTS